MQVWNVLHAARWKYRMQKIVENLPSAHHRTTLSGYIFTTKARIGSQKKLKQQYLLHISSQYGKLWPTSGWDRFGSLGHPSNFQRVSRLGFVTALTSLSARQPNFARCLAISCSGTLYIHFLGLLPHTGNRILSGAKFTLHPSLAFFYIGSVTVRHSSTGRQLNCAAWYLHTTGRPSRLTLGGRTVWFYLSFFFFFPRTFYVCILRARVQPTLDPYAEAFL